MTIDWVSIGIAVLSALLTAILHRTATQPAAGVPAPVATPPQAAPVSPGGGGLFHGGLLHRLAGSASTPPAASGTAASSATGHPVLDSIVGMLQSVVATNPTLLTSLQGVLVQLATPNGTVNLNLSNSGGTSHATQSSAGTPAAAASVATGS